MTDAIFVNAVSDIFNSPIGEDAVYTPAGGAAVTCRVIINRDILLQPDGLTAQAAVAGISIEALLSEIGQEPNRNDVFTVGAEIFTVSSIIRNDGLTVEAVVT
jgi:hypothetical protein